MRTPAASSGLVAVLAVGSLVVVGCTRSNDLAAPAATTPTTVAEATADVASTEPSPNTSADDPAASTTSVSTGATVTTELSTPISVVDVAEIGVPGLDSDDAFCASWSRFAGSFQVVAVTAAFGSGSDEQLAALEVAAAPVVTASYEELLANWPDELSSEADVVADAFLGPFARRLTVANDALLSVGATETEIRTIGDAWVAGLGRRDPSTPEFTVDLPDQIWTVIEEAATVFRRQLVPFGDDPSLVTGVSTPLTNAYLAVSCPDQGTLSGQEVDTG